MNKLYHNNPESNTPEREYVLRLFHEHRQICRNDFVKGIGRSLGRQVSQVGRLIHTLCKKEKSHEFLSLRIGDPRRESYCLAGEKCGFKHYLYLGGCEPKDPAPIPPQHTKQVEKAKTGWKARPAGFLFGADGGRNLPSEPQDIGTFLNFETGRKVRR